MEYIYPALSCIFCPPQRHRWTTQKMGCVVTSLSAVLLTAISCFHGRESGTLQVLLDVHCSKILTLK